jgi:hypothetical protein
VPNRPNGSALRVLRSLAGLLQAVLLALLHPRVAAEVAGLLQRRAVVGFQADEGPGDRQPQRPGLAGDPAAGEGADDVELTVLVQGENGSRISCWCTLFGK